MHPLTEVAKKVRNIATGENIPLVCDTMEVGKDEVLGSVYHYNFGQMLAEKERELVAVIIREAARRTDVGVQLDRNLLGFRLA